MKLFWLEMNFFSRCPCAWETQGGKKFRQIVRYQVWIFSVEDRLRFLSFFKIGENNYLKTGI
jgi:hypothetical protein